MRLEGTLRKPRGLRSFVSRFGLKTLLLGAALAAFAGDVSAQQATNAVAYLQRQAVPAELGKVARGMGPNFGASGKERAVSIGRITRGSGSSTFRLLRQLPNLYRLEETGGPEAFSAIVDSHKVNAAVTLSPSQISLLETAVGDSVEFFLGSAASGGSHRLIGRRFRLLAAPLPTTDPVPELKQLKAGSRTDLYVWGSPPGMAGLPNRQKLVQVDSLTGLISKIEYQSGSGPAAVRIETVYSGWRTVDGNSVPATVERRENGQRVLLLEIQSASFSAAASDTVFTLP